MTPRPHPSGHWWLDWCHPGYTSDVWFRVRSSQDVDHSPLELALEHRPSGTRHSAPLSQRARLHQVAFDARLDLAAAFDRARNPEGDWRLLVRHTVTAGDVAEQPVVPGPAPGQTPALAIDTQAGPVEATVRLGAEDGDADGAVEISVRARKPWAETRHIHIEDGRLEVSGHLVSDAAASPYGRAPSPVWGLLRCREDGREVTLPVQWEGESFHVTLSGEHIPVVRETQTWDMHLRFDNDGKTLRLGRHLDDIAAKTRVFRYPWTRLAGGDDVRCRPYYTTYNNVSLLVRRGSEKKKKTATRAAAASTAADQHQPLSNKARRRANYVFTLLEWAAKRGAAPRTGRQTTDAEGRLLVHILISSGFGLGGTTRTVINLANYLAAHGHDVRLISIFRTRETPFFPIDERVQVRTLCDEREHPDDAADAGLTASIRRFLHSKSSWLMHEEDARFHLASLWVDLQLLRALWSIRSGILVTTRGGLNIIGARLSRPGVVTVGQEHLTYTAYWPGIQREFVRHFRKLDALSVLSKEDQRVYGELLEGSSTRVECIYNALPDHPPPRSDLDARRIVAAGRLVKMKGFDLLVEAFVEVSKRHPDWELRIYGSGRWEDKIRRLIHKHGLTERLLLMGRTDRMEQEMAKASIYVLSSRFEPFGMVLTEALSAGLAVVSFDCEHGPGEIITSGVNGWLVPQYDVQALADGMCRLIEDTELRARLASEAPQSIGAYSMDAIGAQWVRLFRSLS